MLRYGKGLDDRLYLEAGLFFANFKKPMDYNKGLVDFLG
jgi:hypothetical protein